MAFPLSCRVPGRQSRICGTQIHCANLTSSTRASGGPKFAFPIRPVLWARRSYRQPGRAGSASQRVIDHEI
jgi:hypothetical protein